MTMMDEHFLLVEYMYRHDLIYNLHLILPPPARAHDGDDILMTIDT
jgi:hypothetical protein